VAGYEPRGHPAAQQPHGPARSPSLNSSDQSRADSKLGPRQPPPRAAVEPPPPPPLAKAPEPSASVLGGGGGGGSAGKFFGFNVPELHVPTMPPQLNTLLDAFGTPFGGRK
jgi:hypothetical protein